MGMINSAAPAEGFPGMNPKDACSPMYTIHTDVINFFLLVLSTRLSSTKKESHLQLSLNINDKNRKGPEYVMLDVG